MTAELSDEFTQMVQARIKKSAKEKTVLKFGAGNRTASAETTHFADQKIGLLPDWVVSEGAKALRASLAKILRAETTEMQQKTVLSSIIKPSK